ncbi:MAG: MarR family transcriptional regulator [Atopobiaceae bacterium]|nr:MarR family transcriptional regulator [Atopobiaceae bacterium]
MPEEPNETVSLARRVLHNLGYFGHFLHIHAGGRSGQQHILVKLYKSGNHMTQRELQEQSCISSASLSEVLAKLEGAGLIERTRSDEDRRQLDIALTDEGAQRARTLIDRRRRFEGACLACLTDEEQQSLIDMLDRLAEHWEQLEGEGACS